MASPPVVLRLLPNGDVEAAAGELRQLRFFRPVASTINIKFRVECGRVYLGAKFLLRLADGRLWEGHVTLLDAKVPEVFDRVRGHISVVDRRPMTDRVQRRLLDRVRDALDRHPFEAAFTDVALVSMAAPATDQHQDDPFALECAHRALIHLHVGSNLSLALVACRATVVQQWGLREPSRRGAQFHVSVDRRGPSLLQLV